MDTGPHTADVDGVTLAYRAWGPADAPPVVLLHCRGADGTDWAPVARRLAGGPRPRRVYAPDLRGHGGSSRPGDRPGAYAHEALRDDVLGLLDVLGAERADIVGHSLGGAVACLIAQHAPSRVRRLVLEDVPVPLPLDPPRPPAVRPRGELPYDWEMILATDRQRNAPDPAWAAGMGRITAPTLLVAGGAASSVPQDQVTGLAALIPGARVVTVAAGHLVHEKQPEEFLSVVTPFLTGLPSRPS
ncbi:alpha/beta fold hydrolase [Streptomyces sp. NPDC018057]|uniref:alpha/beta fold hydrolase n=1 Tax=unclassified Streptomyces TaxID=2593676 RepID=UPI003793852A